MQHVYLDVFSTKKRKNPGLLFVDFEEFQMTEIMSVHDMDAWRHDHVGAAVRQSDGVPRRSSSCLDLLTISLFVFQRARL